MKDKFLTYIKGLDNFSQRKIATYIQRGTFPKDDLLIAGKKFWKIKTIKDYAAVQLEKRNSYRTNRIDLN